MRDDLGARLLRAGLVTRDQLAEVLASAPPHGGALVAALVARGIPEEALAGFFLADGYGPLMDRADLENGDPAARRRLPGPMAASLLAVPVRASAAGLVVAMAAPSDRHAVREIARVVGGDVLPTVACVSSLRNAIRTSYPGQSAPTPHLPAAPDESQPPVLELRRRAETDEASAAPRLDAAQANPSLGPRLVSDDDEPAVPLVRTKPQLTPPSGVAREEPMVVSKAFARPEGIKRAVVPAPSLPTEARRGTAEYPLPVPSIAELHAERAPGSGMPRATSIVPPEHERWDLGVQPPSAPSPPLRRNPSRQNLGRARSELPPARATLPEIGTVLAAIRSATARDAVVRVACEGAVTVARTAVFLAMLKGVLKGWDGAGGGVSRDALRNLWIPTTSASRFKDVVDTREPYVGPYGSAVADGLFRAAVGSRGGDLALYPIVVSDKVVGVLCADDLLAVPASRARIELLAHAIGEGFKRIIVEKKG